MWGFKQIATEMDTCFRSLLERLKRKKGKEKDESMVARRKTNTGIHHYSSASAAGKREGKKRKKNLAEKRRRRERGDEFPITFLNQNFSLRSISSCRIKR